MRADSKDRKLLCTGIDLGYASTRIAVLANREIVPVPGLDGELEIPSQALLCNDRIYFGKAALHASSSLPNQRRWNLHDLLLLPQEHYDRQSAWIVQCFFEYLDRCIVSFFGQSARAVVVLSPALSGTPAPGRIVDAIKETGLSWERIIETGGALGLYRTIAVGPLGRQEENVLFIDCGARYLTMSLLNIDDGMVHAIQVLHDASPAGNSLDLALSARAVQTLPASLQRLILEDGRLSGQMTDEARRVKEALSYQESVLFSFPDGLEADPFLLCRKDLHHLLAPISGKIMEFSKRLFDADDLTTVILSGSTMKIPALQETADNCFPSLSFFSLWNGFEAAAGAALYCGAGMKRIKDLVFLECTCTHLLLEYGSEFPAFVIPRDTTIPTHKSIELPVSDMNEDNPFLRLQLAPECRPNDPDRLTLASVRIPQSIFEEKDECITVTVDMDSYRMVRFSVHFGDELLARCQPLFCW